MSKIHPFPGASLAGVGFPGCEGIDVPKFPPARYEFAKKAGNTAEIYLYGVIGDVFGGISAAQFASDLKDLGNVSKIDIYINSPGGFVMEGRAIYTRLQAHPARKVVHVDSEASSIASLIAMAGHEIRMAEGSMMLVHRAWTICIGNALDFDKRAAEMRKVDETLVTSYKNRTKMKPEAIIALMDEDRYMSAEEAVRLGFADVAEEGVKAAAMILPRNLLNLPKLPTLPATASTPRKLAALAELAELQRA